MYIEQKVPGIENVSKIISILSKVGETRLVGGAVREMLLDHVPKDVDLATQVLPNEVMELLERDGIKVLPIGIKYGTVMAILGGHTYEITTLRSDISTNGRHAEVRYTKDWEEDSGRRDFTINAMYMDLGGKIYDYNNGIKDIEDRCIRFIGDPNERIKEDHLRILRFFRFYGYYEDAVYDEDTFKGCCQNIKLLSELSGERIRDELFKIFILKRVNDVMSLMKKARVLENIFDCEIKYPTFQKSATDPIVPLAYIFLKSGIDHKKAKLLKLSNADMKTLSILMENHNHDLKRAQLKYSYFFGYAMLEKQLMLYSLVHKEEIETMPEPLNMPKLPVSSNDLMLLGYNGKSLGMALKRLEMLWVDSDFMMDKEALLKNL